MSRIPLSSGDLEAGSYGDMSWLFESRSFHSDQNGTVVARRILGQWSVRFEGAAQTNRYTNAMWADAFDKISAVDTALILGLGGGGGISELHQKFPSAKVTVVEKDPTMIEIARTLKLWLPHPAPEIQEDDAAKAIEKLEKKFDLIVVDLFDHIGISPLMRDNKFIGALKARLSPSGKILVNFAQFTDSTRLLVEIFPYSRTWHFRANLLGAFATD